MAPTLPRVGQVVRATHDLPLVGNTHVTRLSHGPATLPKGTEAEITAIDREHIELCCKDGASAGPSAWGLRIRVAKTIFGIRFE